MGKYIESNLIKDEQIQYKATVSVWSLTPQIAVGLLLLPVFGIGLFFWAMAAITYYSTELGITNKRVIAKFGFIRRQTIEMNIAKVESIQVDQGVFGRICNFGTVLIAGAGDPKAPIPGISNPLEYRKHYFEVQEAIESAQSHSGNRTTPATSGVSA